VVGDSHEECSQTLTGDYVTMSMLVSLQLANGVFKNEPINY